MPDYFEVSDILLEKYFNKNLIKNYQIEVKAIKLPFKTDERGHFELCAISKEHSETWDFEKI